MFATTAPASFLSAQSLKNIVFNMSTGLCSNTTNSISSAGKLTLNGVSIVGRNGVKIMPDFQFQYASNPAYDKNKWDGWGMYCSTCTEPGSQHKSSSLDADGTAWSLTSVVTPLGSTIDIQYERDSYASISGEAITQRLGGGIRVREITTSDDAGKSYKTRYLYDNNGISSGVTSMEPDYIRNSMDDYPFYKNLNYPATPVMYGKVTVLTGKLSTNDDFTPKTVYEFEAPNKSLYTVTPTKVQDKVKVGYDERVDTDESIFYSLRTIQFLANSKFQNRLSPHR